MSAAPLFQPLPRVHVQALGMTDDQAKVAELKGALTLVAERLRDLTICVAQLQLQTGVKLGANELLELRDEIVRGLR